MATFQYIAKDAEGNETRGQVEAADRTAAIAAVRAMGLLPTAMGEVRSSSSSSVAQKKTNRKGSPSPSGGKKKTGLNMEINIRLPKFLQGRIKTKILTQFTRQLATLVNAGLPLMRSIDVLKRQMKDAQLREALEGISETISAGGTFSESLRPIPRSSTISISTW